MGIGLLLQERGLVSRDQLDEAIETQTRTGERLDRVLVRLGYVQSDDVLEAIGQQFAMPIVDLSKRDVSEETLQLLPPRLVFKQQCVPIEREGETLRVATCDPFELTAFDELRLLTNMDIELVLADETDLRKFIRTHYGVAGDTLEALSAGQDVLAEGDEASEDGLDQAEQASVIRLVNDLLIEAVRERATDVHIEPYEDSLEIRYRVDGVLVQAGVPATVNQFRNAIVSRLKIMANLNVAEKRVPQDGRITLRRDGHEFDLRISIIPMLFGEGVVIRILSKTAALLELNELGMEQAVKQHWDQLITRPHGILLVTGPTGSGKSTTLYASLNQIVSDEVKIITVEDPAEYNIVGVNQIQVQREVGLDFAAGLRSILRHDPDIIMVGEIRDRETAEMAVQASLTGHLVFSTLHTNDAAGALPRLLDMGIEPFLVSSTIEGVLAQRLVRRVCEHCGMPWRPDSTDLPDGWEMPTEPLRKGSGCRECRNTGFLGRVGIYELLRIDDQLREMIIQRANGSRLAGAAREAGLLHTLVASGRLKASEGLTTPSEVARVTRD
ncbi:MAG: general secretion pathway protein GspE [Phycisphaerae bacterium]|nr:general secretion pathway protein GspE [Phycisphaerae bacterium]